MTSRDHHILATIHTPVSDYRIYKLTNSKAIWYDRSKASNEDSRAGQSGGGEDDMIQSLVGLVSVEFRHAAVGFGQVT